MPSGIPTTPVSGSSFLITMGPAARVTWSASTSYLRVPPAMSTLPSGRKAWPPQNRSAGVGMVFDEPVAGSHSTVENVPASKERWSLPEPATSSTLPLYSCTAWMPLSCADSGSSTVDQEPKAAR